MATRQQQAIGHRAYWGAQRLKRQIPGVPNASAFSELIHGSLPLLGYPTSRVRVPKASAFCALRHGSLRETRFFQIAFLFILTGFKSD